MLPAVPASRLSTINLVSVFKIILSGALMVIFPALPSPEVKASIPAPSEMVNWGVSIVILPALPVVWVKAEIPPICLFKSSAKVPDMDICSSAIMLIFPAFPCPRVLEVIFPPFITDIEFPIMSMFPAVPVVSIPKVVAIWLETNSVISWFPV